jgi:glycine betaine/proline transport system permease protein
MNKFPEFLEFDIGVYVDLFVRWMVRNFQAFFDGNQTSILWVLGYLEQ